MSEQYVHRMMRCKLDRSARIGDYRYRPGERLRESDKATDDFEEVDAPPPPPVVAAPPPVRAARVRPAAGEKIIGFPDPKEAKETKEAKGGN